MMVLAFVAAAAARAARRGDRSGDRDKLALVDGDFLLLRDQRAITDLAGFVDPFALAGGALPLFGVGRS